MKKIVPDPPPALGTTAAIPFGTCQSSHPPMFSVCSGLQAEDALVHATLLLRGIRDVTDYYCQHHAEETGRGMLWSVLHSAEMAKALVEGVLDGMPVSSAGPAPTST